MKKLLLLLVVLLAAGLLATNPSTNEAVLKFETDMKYSAVYKGIGSIAGNSNTLKISICRDNYYFFGKYWLKFEILYVKKCEIPFAYGFLGKIYVREDFKNEKVIEKIKESILKGSNEEIKTHDDCKSIN